MYFVWCRKRKGATRMTNKETNIEKKKIKIISLKQKIIGKILIKH